DIVGDGQLDGVGRQMDRRRQQDTTHLVGGDGQLLVAGFHEEAFAFLPQAGAEGVDHELHEASRFTDHPGEYSLTVQMSTKMEPIAVFQGLLLEQSAAMPLWSPGSPWSHETCLLVPRHRGT